MNSKEWEKIETIVDEVLENNVENWREYIEKTCSDNPELKSEVTKLLESIFNSEGWLESSESYEEYLVDDALGESPVSLKGETFGAHCATELIAEGGMGAVYLGERVDDDFDHTVAIKVIKAGMGTPDNIRRFNRERSILAGLKHEGIAQLYDGGISENGLSYLIMEYVEGVRIDEYCREKQLTLQERIDLFKQVLNAVMYAHENLVIHRDLKPGNILVTNSGKVKILDFGIAKLLDEDDDSENPHNITRARILTPKYAAPEQILQSTVTTAVDIYTLGVIFYDLLTGSHPYDLGGLSQFEIEQTVLESEPIKPSVKAESAKQKKEIRGDLDAVALKAVRKKPAFRYRTVKDFMDDLNRFQEGLPVTARENTIHYRFQKFLKRHRKAVATTAGILFLMIGFAAFYTWNISQERNKAELEAEKARRISGFMVNIFNASNPYEQEYVDNNLSAKEVLENAVQTIDTELNNDPELYAELYSVLGKSLYRLGENEEAKASIFKSLDRMAQLYGETHASLVPNKLQLAKVYNAIGKRDSAHVWVDEALALLHDANTDDTDLSVLAETYTTLGFIHANNREFEQAEHSYEMAMEQYKELGAEDSFEATLTRTKLADVQIQLNKYNLAEENLFRALDVLKHHVGENHLTVAKTYGRLGTLYTDTSDFTNAEQYFQKKLELEDKLLATEDPEKIVSYNQYGLLLEKMGKYQEAADQYDKAIHLFHGTGQTDSLILSTYLNNYALAIKEMGRLEEALQLQDDVISIKREKLKPDNPSLTVAIYNKAHIYQLMGELEESRILYEEVVARDKERLGIDHPEVAVDLVKLGAVYRDQNKLQKAEETFLEAQTIFDDKFPEDHYRVGEFYLEYGGFHVLNQNCTSAQKFLDKSINIFQHNFEDDYKDLVRAREYYSECSV